MPRYMNQYSASELIQGRSIIAIVALLLLALVLRQALRLSKRDGLWLLLLGVLMAIHWGSYYEALQTANIAMVTAAFYTFPVMTVLLEPLLNWQRLRWQDGIVGVVVLSGILVMTPSLSLENTQTQGMLLGVFTAFFFALRNVLQRKYMQHLPGITSMFYQLFVILACLLVFEWGYSSYDAASAFQPLTLEAALPNWWLWLLLGVCFTAGPHALYLQSLRKLSAKTAGIIACLQPLYAGVLAYVLFTQVPDIRVVIGGSMIVLAAGYESWRATRSA